MSGAVPVVTKLNGITDMIITNGVDGVLVAPGDMEGYSQAIIGLLNNEEKLHTFSAAAQKTARERYSLERMLDEYEKLFEEEDDREHLPCRSTLGWFKETSVEVMKKGVNSKWVFKRVKEIFK